MQRTEYQCSTVAAQEQLNDRRLQKRQEQVAEPDLDQQAVRLVEDCTPKVLCRDRQQPPRGD